MYLYYDAVNFLRFVRSITILILTFENFSLNQKLLILWAAELLTNFPEFSEISYFPWYSSPFY